MAAHHRSRPFLFMMIIIIDAFMISIMYKVKRREGVDR